MKLFFFTVLFFAAAFSFSQKKADEQIAKLDNTQFVINHEEKSSFSVKSSAMKKLIRMGKSAAPKLIAALNDENRNIMAHLVLCHIYFGHASFAGPKVVTENDVHVNKYFLGKEHGEGVVISEAKKGGAYRLYLSQPEAERIREFWQKQPK